MLLSTKKLMVLLLIPVSTAKTCTRNAPPKRDVHSVASKKKSTVAASTALTSSNITQPQPGTAKQITKQKIQEEVKQETKEEIQQEVKQEIKAKSPAIPIKKETGKINTTPQDRAEIKEEPKKKEVPHEQSPRLKEDKGKERTGNMTKITKKFTKFIKKISGNKKEE